MLALLVASAVAGCAEAPRASSAGPSIREPSFAPTTPLPTPAPAAPTENDRPRVPERFPVPPGAEPALVDAAETSVIGRWSAHMSGFDTYNFYAEELPRAGYPLLGLYPGDAGAIIRFDAGGRILQVYLSGDLERTEIVLRTDQP